MRTDKANTKRYLRLVASLAIALWVTLGLSGCEETPVDVQAPAVPTGVTSMTGDGMVTVFWNDLDVVDLAGYVVYRHTDNDPGYGPYYPIATIAWDENYDDASLQHWFDDTDVINGMTYYYAVLAYDDSGNESNLSYELVPDTPRPSGSNAWLYDRLGSFPQSSGFDFADLQSVALAWNNPQVDISVEFDDGNVPWVVTASHAEIQDWGTIYLEWVDYAPREGYSAAGRAELIVGHSYIVHMEQDGTHFAKFEVMQISGEGVKIDWAYQADEDNPELGVSERNASNTGGRNDIIRF